MVHQSPEPLLEEVRSVDEQTHQTSSKGTNNGDGQDPTQEQETNTLEVDSPQRAVAQTNSDGGTSDTHGGRNRQRVLGEDEDSDGGTELHGRATAG